MKKKDAFKIMLVYPNLPMMLVPSVAIGLFTRILKGQGYIVDLFDASHYISNESSSPQNSVKLFQARQFDEEKDLGITTKTDLVGSFREHVLAFQPDFLLVSVVEDAFNQAIELLLSIQDLKIPHLVGGVFPTAAPDLCLENDAVEAIGIAEGEQTIVHAAEAVRKGNSFQEVPGVWYKSRNNEIIKNPMGNLVDIDRVQPDFSLIDESRFYRPMGGRIFKSVPVETYRGCPYSCTYCNSPMQKRIARQGGAGNFLRRKSIEHIRIELENAQKKFQVGLIYFIDDSFLARPQKELIEFCEMYEAFKIPFWMNTRPENCTDDNLKRIKDAGCYRISFGIECGNEQFRKQILKRNVSNRYLEKKFDTISKSGIAFSLNLIIGFPYETRELVMDTVNFVRTVNGYDTITISIFAPYHGTALRDVAASNGWVKKKEISKHTTQSSILNMPPPYLNSREIDDLIKVMPFYCFFPKTEWAMIKKAEKNDKEGRKLFRHFSSIYRDKFLKATQDDGKEFIG